MSLDKVVSQLDGKTLNITETIQDLLIDGKGELEIVGMNPVEKEDRTQLIIGQSLLAIALMMYRRYQEDGLDK